MSFLNDVLNIFIKYYPQLLTGVGNTVLIALTSTVAGLALGLLTGVVRTAPMSKNPILRALHKLLNAIIAIYVEIFRGTPMMVQSMVIYWGYAFATGGDTLPLIADYIRHYHPTMRCSFTEMTHWNEMPHIAESIQNDHLFVVVTARKGTVSFKIALEHLPEEIKHHFSGSNIIIIFPDQHGDAMDEMTFAQPQHTEDQSAYEAIGKWIKKKF